MTIGERIKYLREIKALTQKDIANKLGLESAAVSKYELNLREPNIEALKKLSEIFEVSTDFLLGLTPDIYIGEKDKATLNLTNIKNKYEKNPTTEIIDTDEAVGWVVNELCCGVGKTTYGEVVLNSNISFKEISKLINDFEKAKFPKPQILLKFKDKNDYIMIVEIDYFENEDMPLRATSRVNLYANKLSEKYNVLGLAINVDKNKNCKIIYSTYIKKGENYSIPLLLPKTLLTTGEYLKIMDRL